MATRRERADLRNGLLFISPWLVGFLLLTLLPVAMSLYFSFHDYSMLEEPVYVGLDNYRELTGDPVFILSLTNTLYYAALALPAGLAVSLGLAICLNLSISCAWLYRTIVFLPSLSPVVATALVWLWMFNKERGLFAYLLGGVGIASPPWLTDASWALPALAFMSLWGVGHTVVIYLAGLQDVPRELHEAAAIDGAGPLRRLFHVTLPMLSPVIFFNLIMALIGTWQVFAVPYMMTGGGPARSTMFLSMWLYDNAFNFLRMGYASAIAWIQLLIILFCTMLAFWSGRRWVHYQGEGA